MHGTGVKKTSELKNMETVCISSFQSRSTETFARKRKNMHYFWIQNITLLTSFSVLLNFCIEWKELFIF